MSNEDTRWWVIDSANDDNRLREVSDTANMHLVGIVDEREGGIVAYADPDFADRVVEILNMREV